MPISNDEFEAGTVEEDDEEDEVEPEAVEGGDDTDTETSPIEDEKELITTFLSERHDRAFTEREIVLGVDFSPVVEAETGRSRAGLMTTTVGELTDAVLDITGTVSATAIVVNDVDEALAELVEEGTVETKEVDTDGGTTVYYRLAE